MTTIIERADQARRHAEDMAAGVYSDGVTASESVQRAHLVAGAARDAAEVAQLLRSAGGRPVLADLIRAHYLGDTDAAARVTQAQHAALIARAWQPTADLTGLTGTLINPAGLPIPSTPSQFLDTFAQTVTDPDSRELTIPALWTPTPVGTVDPDPNTPPAPLASHTDALTAPWHYAMATTNVSKQALRWSAGHMTEYELMLRAAVDAALEAVLVAELLAAATPIAGPALDTAAAIDTAEAAAATAWGSDATHLLVNPADAPTVRRNQANRDPAQVITSTAIPAGTLAALSSAALIVLATPAQFLIVNEPGVLGDTAGAYRFGATQSRTPAATIALP